MKQEVQELEEGIDKCTILAGDVTLFFSVIDRRSRWKISKDIEDPSNAIKQLVLIDVNRTYHPLTAEYILFKFTWLDRILSCKTSLSIVFVCLYLIRGVNSHL